MCSDNPHQPPAAAPPLPPPQHEASPPTHFLIAALLLVGISAYTASSQSQVEYLPGFTGKLPFQLETGYIGVGKLEEIQAFYYFVESERSPEDDPLIFWLQGGPGCSGLSGLVYEIGPLTFDYGNFDGDIPKLIYNPYTWTKVANVLFIDQPVGTGYSYAKNAEAYKCNDTLAGKQIYEFLQNARGPCSIGLKFLSFEPYKARSNLIKGIDAGNEPHLNMKGYILGNPLTDYFGDSNGRVPYAHRMGLLSDELYLSAKENCNGNYLSVDSDNHMCKHDMDRVNQCVEKIYKDHILEPWCDLHTVNRDLMQLQMPSSFEEHPARFLHSVPLSDSESWCRPMNYLYANSWANIKLVQEALHVREGTITEWVRFNTTVKYVSYTVYEVSSTVNYHKKFTNRKDCRALILSGDHDMAAPHMATEEWIKSLKLLIRSDWRPWFVKGQIAGYTIEYSNGDYEMTYTTVKGAGHTASEFKPKQCFSMIDRWLSHNPL